MDGRLIPTYALPGFTPSPEETVQERWGSFIQLLSRIINLWELIFDCTERTPIILLDALEANHPYCRLHVRNWTRLHLTARFGDPYEEALARSPCLRSIQAHLNYRRPDTPFYNDAFERILALSPNLEDIAYSSRRIKWESLHPVLLQRWESFIDLQKVKVLELAKVSNTRWMDWATDNRTFDGLKHLTFKVAHRHGRDGSQDEFRSILEKFLSSQSPLESISIVNYHGYISLSHIVLYHGGSLRSLSLHQIESTQGPRPILTLDDLDLIRSEVPHLEYLEFDLNRTREPQENEEQVYKIISSIPLLRRITIHYDLGIHHESFGGSQLLYAHTEDPSTRHIVLPPKDTEFNGIYTKIDEYFAREVWEAVCSSNLEELALYIGERYRGSGGMAPPKWRTREEYTKNWVRVCRNERDDLKDDVSALKVVERSQTLS
ncbi:hypothetical protein PM082_021635 [Marasmius tenuissimus]|nr:hypothetical protein PM082_021635 [Marasmius tenuissimus]